MRIKKYAVKPRAAFYGWSRGVGYHNGLAAIKMVDYIEYLFGWKYKTCLEHVDYFVVIAKVKGFDVAEHVKVAQRVFVPRTISEVFTRLDNDTF